jgi:phage-related protein
VGAVAAAVGLLFVAWQTNFLGIRDIAETVWNFITGLIGGAIDFIVSVISGFLEFLGGIWNGVVEKAQGVWNGITGVIGGAVDAVFGILGGLVGFVHGVWDTISGFFGFIFGEAEKAKATIGEVQNLGTTPVGQYSTANAGGVPEYQTGAWNIPENQMAFLHRGEMVLPPEIAAAVRSLAGHAAGGGGSVPLRATVERSDRSTERGDVTIENLEVNVPVHGLLRAETPQDVANAMRRAAAMGYIIPRQPRVASA